MVTIAAFSKMALSLTGTSEQPHFHLSSFRFNKKIFATLWEEENKVMIKLPLIDQSVFCDYDNTAFYPVPGAWGKKGATFVELAHVRKDMLKDALAIAYNSVSIKKKAK